MGNYIDLLEEKLRDDKKYTDYLMEEKFKAETALFDMKWRLYAAVRLLERWERLRPYLEADGYVLPPKWYGEKDGQLPVLPCKEGDIVWQRSSENKNPVPFKVPNFFWIMDNLKAFGKTIFTRQDGFCSMGEEE